MEWYLVLLVFLLIILLVVLGVLLACMFAGQRCTISLQQRTPNHELTQVQQEQERKRQKKFGNRLKRAFGSSPKPPAPIEPVEDVKTLEFSFKLGDKRNTNDDDLAASAEPAMVLLPKAHASQAERQKHREDLRKKYNL